ncbi:MAG: LD-carboxypeptidase [Gemmatimonadaceae bacterium]|nr:LD-carboxypeptidase [Gemmatimonadaceae bacterium]
MYRSIGTKNPFFTGLHITFPAPLKKNSRVALVSPAGPIADEEDLERARENARSLGWEPVTGKHAGKKHGYLAGEDAHRVEDFNDAIRNPEIDGIWCVRGGYGAMRLLDDIDYAAFAKNHKPLIGYSDITAIHSAIYNKTSLVTFHGPTAREKLTDFSRASLIKAVVEQSDSCGVALNAREIVPGRAEGRLAGGNLSLIAALIGTPYAVNLSGAILILEDVGEPLYRIDRMMHQLLLAGALNDCKAIALGDFTGADENGSTVALDALLGGFAKKLGVPCLAGIPVGHIAEQWTIPIGAQATLDTAERKLNVTLTKG